MRWLYLGNDVISGGPRTTSYWVTKEHDILYGNAGDDLNGRKHRRQWSYYGAWRSPDMLYYEKNHVDYMLSKKNPVTGTVSVQVKKQVLAARIWSSGPDNRMAASHDMEKYRQPPLAMGGVKNQLQNVKLKKTPSLWYRFFNTKKQSIFLYDQSRWNRTIGA